MTGIWLHSAAGKTICLRSTVFLLRLDALYYLSDYSVFYSGNFGAVGFLYYKGQSLLNRLHSQANLCCEPNLPQNRLCLIKDQPEKSPPTDQAGLWKLASAFLKDPLDFCAHIVGPSKVFFPYMPLYSLIFFHPL